MNNIEWVEAGYDYLSATLPLGAPRSTQWAQTGARILEEISLEGHQVKPRSMNGYSGLGVGNCFIGERDDGYFINLTGEYADRYVDAIKHPEMHVSRVDLQITVKFAETQLRLAKEAYSNATHHNGTLPPHKRRKLYIIVGSDDADTLYIGAPSSEQRGRLYNKALQSGLDRYLGCWRYEVVYKNDLASQCVNLGYHTTLPRSKYIVANVRRWYADRGVSIDFLQSCGDVVIPRQRHIRTDVERKLEWLEGQVKPTVRYLCELGFRDTILVLLGLEES